MVISSRYTMPTLTLSVPGELFDALSNRAQSESKTMADVVRAILCDHLSIVQRTPAERLREILAYETRITTTQVRDRITFSVAPAELVRAMLALGFKRHPRHPTTWMRDQPEAYRGFTNDVATEEDL